MGFRRRFLPQRRQKQLRHKGRIPCKPSRWPCPNRHLLRWPRWLCCRCQIRRRSRLPKIRTKGPPRPSLQTPPKTSLQTRPSPSIPQTRPSIPQTRRIPPSPSLPQARCIPPSPSFRCTSSRRSQTILLLSHQISFSDETQVLKHKYPQPNVYSGGQVPHCTCSSKRFVIASHYDFFI